MLGSRNVKGGSLGAPSRCCIPLLPGTGVSGNTSGFSISSLGASHRGRTGCGTILDGSSAADEVAPVVLCTVEHVVGPFHKRCGGVFGLEFCHTNADSHPGLDLDRSPDSFGHVACRFELWHREYHGQLFAAIPVRRVDSTAYRASHDAADAREHLVALLVAVGIVVYANFFIDDEYTIEYKMPEVTEAPYSISAGRNLLILTASYEQFGQVVGDRIYVCHGYWEMVGIEFKYRSTC